MELQWGRDLVIAEIPGETNPGESHLGGFNGAAIW